MKPGMMDGLNTVNKLVEWLLRGQEGKMRIPHGPGAERQRA